jgi:pilus assembly protein CpaC
LNNISQETREQIPIIGSLPIIGTFFKSKSDNRQRTELLVLITPHLVRPLDPDEVPPLPTAPSQFLKDEGGGTGLQGSAGAVDGPALAEPKR